MSSEDFAEPRGQSSADARQERLVVGIHLRAHAGRPAGADDRRALPVAGDDDEAKQVVLALLDELGFDGVDAGGLDQSWRQQPGTPVYGASTGAAGIRTLLAEASPERTPEWRAQA